MNVAFITKRYDTIGGSERNLYELSRRFVSYGHEVHVYCGCVRCPPEPGLHIHHLPRLGIGRTACLWSLAALGPAIVFRRGHDLVISFVRSLQQDIVRNGGGTHKLFLDKIALADSRLKHLVRAMDPYHRSLLEIERRQYRPGHYRRIIANSDVGKQDIISTYGVPEKDITLIYNGVDTSLFNPNGADTYRRNIRRQHGIPADVPTTIFIGSGFKRKGLDVLLQATARLKDRRLHCLVVGTDPSLPMYRDRVRELGIADRVCFAGLQSRPHEYYAAADLFVLPSLYEPFGHSTLEAMACGVPVIGARRTGASGLLRGRLADFSLDDPQDVDALTDRIRRLLDPAVARELSREGVEVSKAFTLDTNARAFEAVCSSVLEEKRRNGHRSLSPAAWPAAGAATGSNT